MNKLKDTHAIGIFAGLCGVLAMLPIEQVLLRTKLMKRSFSETASGVFVHSHHEAIRWQGRLLGIMLEFGLGGLIGVIETNLLKKTGLKHLVPKGLMHGMTAGSIIVALAGAVSRNKAKPKDAVTNIFYVLKSGVYGLVTSLVIAKISDKSIFANSEVPIHETPYSGVIE